MGLLKVERPEIECWSMTDYATLLRAAKAYNPQMYAAVCLAGEAGLRIGEIKALMWKDVDFESEIITISRQIRDGKEGTPKGRTRRIVPMNARLMDALRVLRGVGPSYVLRNKDGTQMTDNQMKNVSYRLCRAAGLEERGWH